MTPLMHEIETYWENRAPGYSKVNQDELQGVQKRQWLEEFRRHLPNQNKKEIKILDIGTGPGFFSIILTEEGYSLTAIDYTPGMLKQAQMNAGILAQEIDFMQMDAQNLRFADETFDVVVSRNLTWNLEDPARAYSEWHRVLKKGGILLNFDANWYQHLFDTQKRREYEEDRKKVEEACIEDHYTCTDIDTMEDIARRIPLSPVCRPAWDLQVLGQLGFENVEADLNVWDRVLSDIEKLNYASTPVFMIKAVK
ncbi:MAG: class I SAM-dependent methyltransferase [Lachnospiraceae bacterium]|nr:class I SAM-dependent methyltransferase [Lachnospiraceae bacterium]